MTTSMSLVEAFQSCARLTPVPDPSIDPDGAKRAEIANERRTAAARVLEVELVALARRVIRPQWDSWHQQDSANSAVSAAYDNLCRSDGESRGHRPGDPDTDEGVRSYLSVVLRYAFFDCLGVGDTEPQALAEGDASDEAVNEETLTDDVRNDDVSVECHDHGERLVRAVVSRLTAEQRACILQCVARRTAELAVGRAKGSEESINALRAVWDGQVLAHAEPEEVKLLRQQLSDVAWRKQFEDLGELIRNPSNDRVVYCDDPPAAVGELQRKVMNRMAQRQGRALSSVLDETILELEAARADDDACACAIQAVYALVPGRKGTIPHRSVSMSRKKRSSGT